MLAEKCEYLPVADCYAGKSVFITGGSGFLGKVIIEKLLYSCEHIDKVYVLLRDKRGVTADRRLQEIVDHPLFRRIKETREHDLKKLVPIVGDITVPNLGIKQEDEETLIHKVSHVFHSAATVKFNEPLREALKINVEGTQNTLELCRRMKNIEVFVHVSTAFTNTDKSVIDEVVYPPPAELDDVYQFVKKHDNDEENYKILNGRPNTYTFTKALAETLIEKHHGNIPVIIVRPSIVTAVKDEPLRGWINNWYGATGILTTSAKGLNRIAIGSASNVVDIIPVDYVANFVIVAGAKSDRSNTISVYNCGSSSCNPVTLGEVLNIFTMEVKKHNSDYLPFPEIFVFAKYEWMVPIITLLLQTIPAFIADTWRWLWGKPPRYIKLQRLITLNRDALTYFSSHLWVIRCEGVCALSDSLSAYDRRRFPCNPADIDWRIYVPVYCEGIRRYLEPNIKADLSEKRI